MKLTHFFRHVLDMNHDDVISAEDFVALNQVSENFIKNIQLLKLEETLEQTEGDNL